MAAALPPAALQRLEAGAPVLLLSADARGRPHSTYSWAVAVGARRLRVAVDCGGRTSANWRRSGWGAVQLIGEGGLNLLISGRTRLLAPALPGAPGLESWQLAARQVLDQSWPGVATSALRYRWPPGRRAEMRRHERGVCRGLREGVAGGRL